MTKSDLEREEDEAHEAYQRGFREGQESSLAGLYNPVNGVKAMVVALRELGVTKYKTAEVELELGPLPQPNTPANPDTQPRSRKLTAEEEMHERRRIALGASSSLVKLENDSSSD